MELLIINFFIFAC